MTMLTERDALERPHYAYAVSAEQLDEGWGVRIGGDLYPLQEAVEFADALQVAVSQARHLTRHPRANQALLEWAAQSRMETRR